MKLKELFTVLDSNAYWLRKEDWMYEDKAIFITSDLLERTVNLVVINRNEFLL